MSLPNKFWSIVLLTAFWCGHASATVCTAGDPRTLIPEAKIAFIATITQSQSQKAANNAYIEVKHRFIVKQHIKGDPSLIPYIQTTHIEPGTPDRYKAWSRLNPGDHVVVIANRAGPVVFDNCLGPSVTWDGKPIVYPPLQSPK